MTTVQQNSAEVQELQAVLAVLESESKNQGNNDPILAAIIKQISEVLAALQGGNSTPPQGAQSSAPTPQTNPTNGAPTNNQISTAMAQLAEALAELQVLLGKYGQEKQNMTNNDMQNLLLEAQAFLKQAQNDLQKLEDQQSSHHWWDIFIKVVTAIVGAVFAAIAFATGNVALGIVIIALTVAAETGAFGEATKLISDALVAMGVPPKDANIIASVVVIVAVIAATVLTCGAAAPEAAADVADVVAEDVGTEMTNFAEQATEEVTETAQTTTETVAEQSNTVANTAKNALNTVKNAFLKVIEVTFGRLPASVNMAILTGSQALMGTDLVNNILAACPMSDKKRQELEKILGIITEVLCSLASIGAGMGAGMAAGATSSEAVFTQSTMNKLALVGMGAQASGSFGDFELAHIDSQEADLEADLGSDEALSSLVQTLSKMNESLITSGNTFDSKTQAAHTQGLNQLIAALSNNTLAQVLAG
ncbi:MAG: hypothetical protein JSR39_02145 [Verrucomicrobia bacterium]|nr:hypothetical protein [Verrucomicrobiota bacterium]